MIATVYRKILMGENFGKVKGIGTENLANTFSLYLWILAKKILANSSRFTKFFPCQYFPVYSI